MNDPLSSFLMTLNRHDPTENLQRKTQNIDNNDDKGAPIVVLVSLLLILNKRLPITFSRTNISSPHVNNESNYVINDSD